MTHHDRRTFAQRVLASGLLTEQQLAEAMSAMRSADGADLGATAPGDDELADRLVALGLLNTWQVKQLRAGHTKFSLGPYRIVDSIGQGGMGHVFKALDASLNRVVAVKVLPRYRTTPESVASFTREIRAASNLQHPRLVAAFDAGHDGNVHYMVTEFVPGFDLRKWVRRVGPLSMTMAASIISQVAEGLQYAHSQGIVHRDVKPGNVLVTPQGVAKLSDLGLAESLTADASDNPHYGKIVGTADYLSPDQVQDPKHPTPAWDIYSLGCTLYYAVTGKVPFPGGTTADKARAHCGLRPLDPRRLNPTLTDDFVDIIADMMAKDPTLRTPSAGEVIAQMSLFLAGATGKGALPTGAPDRGPPAPSETPSSPPSALPLSALPVLPPEAQQVVQPFNPALAVGWPAADTQTDVAMCVAGAADDDDASGSFESFDLSFLDEDVMPSIDNPQRKLDEVQRSVWPKRVLLFAALIGVALIALYLIEIAQTLWSLRP